MKASKEHRVPLSTSAITLIKKLAKAPEGPLVFPGADGAELSENAMLALLERMGHDDITVHGFRSTFKDWATEKTNLRSNSAVRMREIATDVDWPANFVAALNAM